MARKIRTEDILRMAAGGLSGRAIADALGVSRKPGPASHRDSGDSDSQYRAALRRANTHFRHHLEPDAFELQMGNLLRRSQPWTVFRVVAVARRQSISNRVVAPSDNASQLILVPAVGTDGTGVCSSGTTRRIRSRALGGRAPRGGKRLAPMHPRSSAHRQSLR